MGHRFHIVDVFAEQPYAGNPLAVVIADPDTLANDTMQRIAAETNCERIRRQEMAPPSLAPIFSSTACFRNLALRIEPGDAVGRPSLVRLRARKSAQALEVRVGGQVIPIVQGELL